MPLVWTNKISDLEKHKPSKDEFMDILQENTKIHRAFGASNVHFNSKYSGIGYTRVRSSEIEKIGITSLRVIISHQQAKQSVIAQNLYILANLYL